MNAIADLGHTLCIAPASGDTSDALSALIAQWSCTTAGDVVYFDDGSASPDGDFAHVLQTRLMNTAAPTLLVFALDDVLRYNGDPNIVQVFDHWLRAMRKQRICVLFVTSDIDLGDLSTTELGAIIEAACQTEVVLRVADTAA